MTDNGTGYRSRVHASAIVRLGIGYNTPISRSASAT
jgi:hypothetical protein